MTTIANEWDQISRFTEVLRRVDYPTFNFTVSVSKGTYYFQIECDDKCNTTGADKTWKSRKWLLSVHMTDGEIVQTAFKAALTALEHETREKFLYRGVAIFDPHYDIEALVKLRSDPNSIKGRDQ